MAELAYVRARREAAELLDAHWDGILPVKLGPITDSLEATKHESPLGDRLSGFVTKEKASRASIVLNSEEPAERRRFTWAHELGHILERNAIAKDDDYSFTEARGRKYDLHEFFADEFAGALLMPPREVNRMKEYAASVAEMASKFGVSIPAMRKRLDRLAAQQ